MNYLVHCPFLSKSYKRLAWMSCAWDLRRLDGHAGPGFAAGASAPIRKKKEQKKEKEKGERHAVVAVLTFIVKISR